MINLKKLLLKLLQKETIIGESNESYLNLMYPIGSEFITATNMNPGTWLGGTWTLVDKQFSQLYAASNEGVLTGITWDSTNVQPHATNARNITVLRTGHTLKVYAVWYNKVAIGEDDFHCFDLDTTAFGMSSGRICGQQGIEADGLAAIGMSHDTPAYSPSATISCTAEDWVTYGTSYSANTGSGMITSFEVVPGSLSAMNDSACDRFYWKRTA